MQRMIAIDQEALIKKFDKYLNLTGGDYPLDMYQGLCFGFSLCIGAMDVSKTLPWWKAARKNISFSKRFLF